MQKFFFVIPLVILNYALTVIFLLQFWVLEAVQYLAYLLYPINDLKIDQPMINKESIGIILRGQQSSDLFTKLELQHLLDVHRVFIGFACMIFASLIILFSWNLKNRKWRIQLSGKELIFTAQSLIVLTIVSAVFFRVSFEAFHQVLFPQGNYSFPAESTLIQAYPPQFWFLQLIFLQSGVILLLVVEALLIRRLWVTAQRPHADTLDL